MKIWYHLLPLSQEHVFDLPQISRNCWADNKPVNFPSDWNGELDHYSGDLLVYTRHSAFPYGKLTLQC